MFVLMTAPCCKDDWVQLVSVTVLKNNLWASMYILAKEEGSARLGSIPASLTSSVMEVFRIANCLDAGDLLQLATRVKTDFRNSEDFCGDVEDFIAEDNEEGIKWGNVSRR